MNSTKTLLNYYELRHMFTDNLKFQFGGDSVNPDFPMRGFTIIFKNNYSSKYFCLNFTRVLVMCKLI